MKRNFLSHFILYSITYSEEASSFHKLTRSREKSVQRTSVIRLIISMLKQSTRRCSKILLKIWLNYDVKLLSSFATKLDCVSFALAQLNDLRLNHNLICEYSSSFWCCGSNPISGRFVFSARRREYFNPKVSLLLKHKNLRHLFTSKA